MTTTSTRLATALAEHGYSNTKSRYAVFQALENTKPISMNHLVKMLEPSVNRASVYRTVALFEQLGIVQRLQIGWKYKLELSNDFQEHHHHLTCLHCGKVITFHEPPALHQALATIADDNSFVMQQHQVELTGTCADCVSS